MLRGIIEVDRISKNEISRDKGVPEVADKTIIPDLIVNANNVPDAEVIYTGGKGKTIRQILQAPGTTYGINGNRMGHKIVIVSLKSLRH